MNSNGMKLFVGCVENRNDPLQLGRCQCRIIGLHTEDKTLLPTEDLPWAYPVQPITSAGVSGVGTAPIGPVEGSWLLLSFLDPDLQQPLMVGSLGGSFQTASAIASGKIVHNVVDADGSVVDSIPIQSSGATVAEPQAASNTVTTTNAAGQTVTKAAPAATDTKAIEAGKIYTQKDSIIGPLAKLIAKAESGSQGYNAFNRGTSGGKIVGGGSMNLVSMSMKDIMAKQSLPPGAPDRLFAVGKYQCIPITLREACNSLNLDPNCTFNETIQDRICQEYLVGKKRPALIAYYNDNNKMNEALLVKAGKALAAEFASIEDPEYPGYPYGGPNGKYYKGGNKVGTKWSTLKTTLIQEWEFRNGKGGSTSTFAASQAAIPPTIAATNDKTAKGTDYYGVAKLTPVDDSKKSVPKEQTSSGGVAGISTGSVTDSLGALGDVSSLVNLGISGDLLKGLGAAAISGIIEQASAFKDLVSSVDLTGPLSQITDNAGSILSDFGDSLSEIASNLGLDNVGSSLTELVNELGLSFPSQEAIVAELEKIAGSEQGQARSLLAKLEAEGEPTGPNVAPIGKPNADGSISTGNAVDPLKGFQDPNGQYPRYRSEPDTNRLATGNNLGRTYVLKKEASRKTSVPVANGGSWDQSPVPYNAKYPYNKVTQTESGHVMELDDTPGSERVHFWHKAGSYLEWDANGTQVNRIVGDGFNVYERNGCIYVKGACNVSVDGALNVRTDNIMNLEVSGAAKINIYNNATVNISGNCDLAVGAELNAKAAKINLESTGQFNIKAGTGLNVQSGSDTNFKVGGDLLISAGSDISQKATGSFYIQTAINANIKTTGKFNLQSDNDINVKTGKAINIQSTENANINSAKSVNIQSETATNIKSADAINIQSDGSYNTKSGAGVNIESTTNMHIKAGAVGYVGASGMMNLNAGGVLAMDGTTIDIQNGASSPASGSGGASGAGSAGDSKEALAVRPAGQTDLELPIETRGTSGVASLPPLSVPTRGSEVPFDSPDAGGGAAIAQFQNRQIATNALSSTDVSSTSAVNQTNKPNATSGASPGPVAGLDAIKAMSPAQFTAGMKLSKYFTLGDLTAGGTRIPNQTYTLGDGTTITPQEIVCNLKVLAETALDPIRDKLGSFTITSCFRRPGDLKQKEGGDHPKGCAADIVFPGGKTATFDAAGKIVTIIPCWNQVLMEYNGSQHWVHVAVKPSNNKGEMFTMNCHSKVASTYPKGGFVLI